MSDSGGAASGADSPQFPITVEDTAGPVGPIACSVLGIIVLLAIGAVAIADHSAWPILLFAIAFNIFWQGAWLFFWIYEWTVEGNGDLELRSVVRIQRTTAAKVRSVGMTSGSGESGPTCWAKFGSRGRAAMSRRVGLSLVDAVEVFNPSVHVYGFERPGWPWQWHGRRGT